jgi:hypothetical protein
MKYIDVDRLRKEIDHRIDILEDMSIKCAKNDDTEMHAYYHGKAVSLQELLSFIDSFQQEQPSLPDNLDEAAEDFVWEIMENDEDGVSDLCRKLNYLNKITDFYDGLAEFFKAGARWAMQHKG